MNRKKAELWLSAMVDGELSPSRQRKLEAYLRESPDLADLREQWESMGTLLRNAEVEDAPTPEVAWSDVQRAIRLQKPGRVQHSVFGVRTLAAVAVGVLLVAGVLFFRTPSEGLTAAGPTEVEWVESDLPGAMSVVYQDEESGWTVIWVDVPEDEVNQDAG